MAEVREVVRRNVYAPRRVGEMIMLIGCCSRDSSIAVEPDNVEAG